MSLSEVSLPERMFQRERPADQSFDPSEELYFRCKKEHLLEQRVLPTAIRFPNFSVNRAKYSEPQDVLLPSYQECGILTFQVVDIPQSDSADEKTTYEWRVEHVPCEKNYSHSEVRTFKNEIYKERLDVGV